MKFAVGYQQPHNREFFSSIVKDYHQKIDEVYFAWPGHASGRLALNNTQSTRQKIQKELLSLRRLGIKLDLLFNANCYGAHGVSSQFEKEIRSTLDSLAVINCLPEIITTTSLMVARTVKKYFPDIDVRASVNMRIGSIQAMG